MPKIGLRNIKTAISVFICVAIYLAIALFVNIFYFDFAAAASLAHPSTNALFTRSQLASV